MKKRDSLKYRIIFHVTAILAVCTAVIVIFENIAGNIKIEFSDKSMATVFDDVRVENEKRHVKLAGKELQDITGTDEVIDFLSGNPAPSNKKVISGLFITLSESIGAQQLVLVDRHLTVVFSEKIETSLADDSVFSSDTASKAYKKAETTWENHGFSIDSEGKVTFIVATAVINDNDEVVGFAACELPIAKLAATFAKTVKGRIAFQGSDLSFTGSSDDAFFRLIPEKVARNDAGDTGIILKFEGAESEDKGQQANGSQPSFYKLYPIQVSDGGFRYWVSLEYTPAALAENRLSIIKPVVVTGVLVAGVVILFVLLSWQLRPLEYVVDVLKDIAEGEGDLTRRIKVKARGEIGELARWFNAFVERLHQIVTQIGEDSKVVTGASKDLLEISGSLEKNAGDLSFRSDSVTSASQGMSESMNSVASASEEASVNLDSVSLAAGKMRADLASVTQNCAQATRISGEAGSQMESASARVRQLGDSAMDIGKVIDVINKIAGQTNFLALNATIEASRAGQAGRGFAVVADEIKALATQTASATSDIQESITRIQESTEATVTDVEKITETFVQVSEIVSQITRAIDEQSEAAVQVAENIEQASAGMGDVSRNIAQSSQASAGISEDVAGVNSIAAQISSKSATMNENAHSLSSLATRLRERIKVFKV